MHRHSRPLRVIYTHGVTVCTVSDGPVVHDVPAAMRSVRAHRRASARLLPSDADAATAEAATADALAVDAQETSASAVAANALVPLAAAVAGAATSAAASAGPSPIGSTSLASFHAHVAASGLRAVRSAQYNAASLYQLADAAFTFEERIATGCFMLQAVALVQCFCLINNQDPLQHEKDANGFGQF